MLFLCSYPDLSFWRVKLQWNPFLTVSSLSTSDLLNNIHKFAIGVKPKVNKMVLLEKLGFPALIPLHETKGRISKGLSLYCVRLIEIQTIYSKMSLIILLISNILLCCKISLKHENTKRLISGLSGAFVFRLYLIVVNEYFERISKKNIAWNFKRKIINWNFITL